MTAEQKSMLSEREEQLRDDKRVALEASQGDSFHLEQVAYVKPPIDTDALRDDIVRHLESLRLLGPNVTESLPGQTKVQIRQHHSYQRTEKEEREERALATKWPRLMRHFANGDEVRAEWIEPELVPVQSDDETGALFRLATLLWSIPVSSGYGRRMRYLVRDRGNGKLIGIFALGDPVFNLGDRDRWIGWNVDDRRARLVNIMDAYVVGAVPPYSHLLGGKLVASLIGSAEVNDAFTAKYGNTTGIISQANKGARLALVTVTSALGRSSIYNRLKLRTSTRDGQRLLVELVHIGVTQGYGHFHLSDDLFERLRQLLAQEDHTYANAHQFGDGPNWRIRVARVGLSRLGLDDELLKHGISRYIYAMPLASNFREFLCGQVEMPLIDRPTATTLAQAALDRWVIPRAERRPEYVNIRREDYLNFVYHRLLGRDRQYGDNFRHVEQGTLFDLE